MNDELLKDYIKNVYTLESSVYRQTKLCNKLYKQSLEVANYEEEPYVPENEKKTTIEEQFQLDKRKLTYSIVLYPLGFAAVGALIMLFVFIFEGTNILDYIYYIINSALIGAAIGIIYLIYTIVKKYREAVRKVDWINNQAKYINKLADMINDKKREIWAAQTEFFNKVIEQEQRRRSDTEKILKLYYDYNIISPQYRNLTAVSTFYDYFSSEKSDKSDGMNGAYTFYENKLMHNNIPNISKISTEDKENIKTKFPMMYAAVFNVSEADEAAKAIISSSKKGRYDVDENSSVKIYRENTAAQNAVLAEWIKQIQN